MKHSRTDVRGKAKLGLDIRFESQSLTSYSGLIVFQHLFSLIGIKERLWRCFRHLKANPIYGHHMIMMLLVVHLIIGHRRLRDVDSYRDDEMVKRTLGLKRLPDVSTVSRSLASADGQSVVKVQSESRHLVMERLAVEGLSRVTVDFDGSVLSTGRHAEGTAVGFNKKKKKGARSYYPLFCTIAQTDQVLDVHHRPGNVHDSNGADTFIGHCIGHVRSCLPHAQVETRIDSAFFNEVITERLHGSGVEFTLSVPFERFAALKGLVEGRRRWRRMAPGLDYFETRWKPKSVEYPLSLHLHQKAGQMPRQAAHSTRPVSTHRIRVRIQGHRHQQKNEPAQGRCLPRRPRLTGGHLRRAQDALPDGLRTGQDPGRQPTVHVRRHPRSQPHSRATDPTRPSRPWHDRKARRAVVLPGDWDPSSYPHPVCWAHDSPSRQMDPLHEQQRPSRKRAPTCSRNTERRRLTYILREFMQQSG